MKTTILRTIVVMSSLLAILSLSLTTPRGYSATSDVSDATTATTANNNTNTNSNAPAPNPNSGDSRILEETKLACCERIQYAPPTTTNTNKSK